MKFKQRKMQFILTIMLNTTGHLGTGFSWFHCVYKYKRMLRWFPRLQVATACFSCSTPDL